MLELLILSENHLTSLPESAANLKNLKRLDLRHNKLVGDLPKVVYQLDSMVQLFLNYNRLERLHPALANLTNLVNLDLRYV